MKHQNKRIRIISLYFFFTLFIITLASFHVLFSIKSESLDDINNINYSEINSRIKTASYQHHGLINITSNSQFDTQASLESWTGNGSASNPYIIEGYEIIANNRVLVSITNTSYYFQIKNCYFRGGGVINQDWHMHMVFLNNVQNVIFDNNTIVCDRSVDAPYWDGGNSILTGIRTNDTQNINITNNRIYNCTEHGILFTFSTNCIVINNYIYNFRGIGLYLWNSKKNFVQNNTIVSEKCFRCVDLTGTNRSIVDNNTLIGESEVDSLTNFWGYYNNITNNIIQGSRSRIAIYTGDHNIIFRNSVIDGRDGILISMADNTTVYNNSICNYFGERLVIDGSSRNSKIKWNNFWDHSNGLHHGGEDNGSSNIIEENYWSDHDIVDGNSDGFADDEYRISGISYNQDPLPLANPNLIPLPHHLITSPRIISPNGTTISGTVNVSWHGSIDLRIHDLTYSVYYSPDNGSNWILLASGLPQDTTWYSWDTTTVSNGDEYLLRVAAFCSDGNTANNPAIDCLTIDNTLIQLGRLINILLLDIVILLLFAPATVVPLFIFINRRITVEKLKNTQISTQSSIHPVSGIIKSRGRHIGVLNFDSSVLMTDSQSKFQNPSDWSIRLPYLFLFLGPPFWIINNILFPPSVRKLTSEKVYDNPMRKKIIEFLEEVKFEHFNVLREKLNCGVSTLKWHLQVLEDFGLIKSKRVGKYYIFYIKGPILDEFKVVLYCSIRSYKALKIVKFLLSLGNTAIDLLDISLKLDMNYDTLRYHCKKLVKLNVLIFNEIKGTFHMIPEKRNVLFWLLHRNNIR